ncbi:MAG TPA: glycosyltransferase 87 family protein, partial [Thermoleophilaceae bacterium]|nr:glycosyltransferase 87 family protein [Thermoleophilaceae bacterium]
VIGADRVVDGDELYGEGFSEDVERGDTYGPLSYVTYVPFEQALPWSGRWDDLPAAHGAAISFDLLVVAGLLLLGGRLRPGREGRLLGLALAYAWTAYPYTAFALETNSNDSLVALACVGAMLALTASPARSGLAAAGRGIAVGFGAAAKFAPLALAPLFAIYPSRARSRPAVFGLALLAVLALTVLPFLPDGGFRELYDRTVGYQVARPSPFSVWGQTSLDWAHTAAKALVVALAVGLALVPRERSPRQMAALGAVVLIAVQLVATHWFYLYVVWFVPFVFVACLGAYRLPVENTRPATPPREREVVLA